jgi:hypothetical protein
MDHAIPRTFNVLFCFVKLLNSATKTTEGVWKRSKDFDVSTKSTQRKFTFSPTAEELGVESKVDLVPTWKVPHLFRWNGYWIDVSRGKGGEGVVMNEFGPQSPATLKFQYVFNSGS